MRVSERELLDLPRLVTDLYEQRWAELPENVKRVLMFSVASLPPDCRASSWFFMQSIVTRAVGRSRLVSSREVDALSCDLASAVEPYRWILTTGDPGF